MTRLPQCPAKWLPRLLRGIEPFNSLIRIDMLL